MVGLGILSLLAVLGADRPPKSAEPKAVPTGAAAAKNTSTADKAPSKPATRPSTPPKLEADVAALLDILQLFDLLKDYEIFTENNNEANDAPAPPPRNP